MKRHINLPDDALSCLPELLCPWDSPGKNTGLGCHSLLQGIFMTQGLNPCLLHCRHILYHLVAGEALKDSCQCELQVLSEEGGRMEE